MTDANHLTPNPKSQTINLPAVLAFKDKTFSLNDWREVSINFLFCGCANNSIFKKPFLSVNPKKTAPTNIPMCKARPLLPAVLLPLLAVCCLAACQAPKKTAYFQTIQRDTVLQNTVTKNFDLKIRPGDQLAITIASASAELSGQFNTAPGGEGGAGGYAVDKAGKIRLYKLGDMKAAGLSRAELREELERQLQPYLKDPVVTVNFVNHKVTVLGAVGSPGVITLTSDQLNILEAIGQSGDLAENSQREKVLLIRQTEAGKEFRHLNLLDHSIFTSPYFYLQNEDVVYVEPEPKKEASRTTQIYSYIISGISIIALIVNWIR